MSGPQQDDEPAPPLAPEGGAGGAGAALDRLDATDRWLLDVFQHDFPRVSAPFAAIGHRCGLSEAQVCQRYVKLRKAGFLARIGAVFRPHRVGASTLAGMAVPPEKLDAVAALVNRYPEVNHNYAREHTINLWFVVTADTRQRVSAVLAELERCTGLAVLDLPLEAAYHLDLGFPLWPQSASVPPLIPPSRP